MGYGHYGLVRGIRLGRWPRFGPKSNLGSIGTCLPESKGFQMTTHTIPDRSMGSGASRSFTIEVMALVILDVRSPAEFAASHLRGAINVDFQDPGFRDKVSLLSRQDSYITYCNGGRRGGRAAETMRWLGFAKVDGYAIRQASLATGLPIVDER